MDLTHQDVLEILALLDAADVEHFELRTGDTVIVAGRAAGTGPSTSRPGWTGSSPTGPAPDAPEPTTTDGAPAADRTAVRGVPAAAPAAEPAPAGVEATRVD